MGWLGGLGSNLLGSSVAKYGFGADDDTAKKVGEVAGQIGSYILPFRKGGITGDNDDGMVPMGYALGGTISHQTIISPDQQFSFGQKYPTLMPYPNVNQISAMIR